jgi:hypothetical protein
MPALRRRTLLAALGSTLALPILEATTPARAAPGDDLRRFVVFHFPNGCYLPDWTPPTLGPAWTSSPILDAVAAHRDEITVVSGLSNEAAAMTGDPSITNPHARRFPVMLTCAGVQPSGAGGPSVDQVVASALAGTTPVPSLVVALGARNDLHEGRFSFSAPDAPIAPILDPDQLFEQLFAGATLDAETRARIAAERRSVLDRVTADIEALRTELGAVDRARLDQHLDAVRALEQSIQELDCTPPAPPPATSPDDPAQREQRCHALLDLCAMALACDATRVVVFSIHATAGEPTYPFLGIAEGDHTISHLPVQDPASREKYRAITHWKLQQFAALLDRLAVPEGERLLLDRCAVVGLSEISHGGAHDARALPVLVAGGLGGHVGGSHLAVPCDPTTLFLPMADKTWCTGTTHTPLANLWLTAMRAMDLDDESFGDSTGTVEGLWSA